MFVYSISAETKDNKVVIIVPVVVGIVTFAICTFFLWSWMAKRKGNISLLNLPYLKGKGKVAEFSGEYLNEVKLQDLPIFNFEKLATATNNFHLSNKLGQGGFGPVYKVTLAA